MGLNWLVTGGCGFLGVNLISSLVQDEATVSRIIALDDLSVGTPEDLSGVCNFAELEHASAYEFVSNSSKQRVGLVVGDVLDESLAVSVTRGADVVVHFAAATSVASSVEDPRRDLVTNVIGTFNYLDAARRNQIKRFIFASSGAPAGDIEPPVHEEVAPHPVSPYGASKLAGEGYCSAFARTFGLETVCLRFGNVYGPRSNHKSSVVAKFIRQALAGQPLEVYGDGYQTRDFIYVEDLVAAVRKAATSRGVGGEVFQIATQSETTIRELLEHLAPVLVKAGVPAPQVVYTDSRQGDVRRSYAETSKAAQMLGWQASVALPEGLESTLLSFMADTHTMA